MNYLVRLFDARPTSSTSGAVVWLRRPADKTFARKREIAFRFPTRGQALAAAERLPALYHPEVEAAP